MTVINPIFRNVISGIISDVMPIDDIAPTLTLAASGSIT